MSIRYLLFIGLLVPSMLPLCATAQAPTHDPDLAELRTFSKIYTNQLSMIERKCQTQGKRIAETFKNQLGQLEATYQAKGNLKGVLAVRAECKHLDLGLGFPGESSDNDPPELRDLKTATRLLPQALTSQKNAEIVTLAKAYLERLTPLQSELTKKGKIDAALVIHREVAAVTDACRLCEDALAETAVMTDTGHPVDGSLLHQHPVSANNGKVADAQPDAQPKADDATIEKVLNAAIEEDMQEAQNALKEQDLFMAVACFQNAQSLTLITRLEPGAGNRTTTINDALVACETTIAEKPIRMKCPVCKGTGKEEIEMKSLVGTQPLRSGPLGTKTCTQCQGKKQLTKILTEDEKRQCGQEAGQIFSEAQAANRIQIGQTWVPTLAAASLRPRLRAVLLQHRCSHVCATCGGKGKQPCFACSGKGWRACTRCRDGTVTETSYSGNRVRTRDRQCPVCKGTRRVPCDTCHETGLSSAACHACNGTGKEKPCSSCNGLGVRPCYCGGRYPGCEQCGGDNQRLCPMCQGTGFSRY